MNSEESKKPFYKKWWFWVIVAVILIAFIVPKDDDTKTVVTQEESPETANEVATEEEVEEKKDEVTKIEVDETVTSVDYTAKVQRVKIDDNILTVVFDWENQSDWDPAHFEVMGYVVAEQNGEPLEEIINDRKYKQIKHGSFDVYDLEYKLIDDSDVTIRIVSTNEYDGSEGTITVSLE